MAKGEGKVVAQNKKARHDYTIVETIETGMVPGEVCFQPLTHPSLVGQSIPTFRALVQGYPRKRRFPLAPFQGCTVFVQI